MAGAAPRAGADPEPRPVRLRVERTLYRGAMALAAAAVLSRLALRRDRAGIAARLGRGPGPEQDGPHLWLHAASVGELNSARPVILALEAARPDLPIVVTCNTATGVARARAQGLPARLAPLDLAGATDRFAARWQVAAHIAMEAEIWPVRLARLSGPVLVLGARMSAGTARGWARLPALARATLGRIAFLSAQDAGSRDRLLALGLRHAACGPVADLKAFYAAPPAPPADPALEAAYPRDATWLAASLHPGEDEVVIAAHLAARAAEPGLRLILAPRHPDRGDALEARLRAEGLSVARRSRNDPPGAEVLLADTLGEMPIWYGRAGRVFIGGTLSDRGGHTPYEPARFGAALIHGPDTRNFRAPFETLARARAARCIRDSGELAAALTALADPARRDAEAARAAAALQPAAELDELVQPVLAALKDVAPAPPGPGAEQPAS
ncbi:3-deoxy-D-manno-octulosonic acid transferase [Roseivivax sp. CAU 1761]